MGKERGGEGKIGLGGAASAASSSTESTSFSLAGQWAQAVPLSWLYFLQVRAPAVIAGVQASFSLFPGQGSLLISKVEFFYKS